VPTNGRPSPARVLLTGRVPAFPARVALELYAADDPLAATRTLLAQNPLFDAALALASPTLHAALGPWRSGETPKKKRAPYKALAYALRMATRPTPFGLFAGTGTIESGPASSLRLAPRSRSRLRAGVDLAWLYSLHEALEADQSIRGHLPVVANDLVVLRGDRLFPLHPDRLSRGHADGDALAWYYEPFSLRWSETLRAATEACASEAPLDVTIARLAERLAIPAEVAARLADRLLEAGVLVFTRPSPIGNPLAELADSLAPDAGARSAALRDALRTLGRLRSASPATIDQPTVAQVSGELGALYRTGFSPVSVDLIETFDGALGDAVVADVLSLGGLMLASAAPRSLDRYRERFMLRYEGGERRVSLLELVDPDAGIGVPDDTSLERPDRDRLRDEIRFTLAARALRDRSFEVVLSRAELDELHPGHARMLPPPNGCEIGFQVAARDAAALRNGDYRIRPVFGLNTDGAFKTISRFADALGPGFADRLRALESQPGSDDALPAELVYVPQDHHYANLLRPALPRHAIASRHERLRPGTPRIEPRDVVIALEDGRFVASSVSLRRRLRIHESYMLSTPYFAPPHMRLLSLIGKQDDVLPRLFDWGSAAAIPFLPRVRYGRIVLAAARWAVPRRLLATNKGDLAAFVAAWRTEWNVPRWVYLVERDMKLLLDLDSPVAVELLRDEIGASNDGYPPDALLRFEEMFPSFDELWLERDGEPYLHEFVAGIPGRAALAPAPARRVAPDDAIPKGPGSDRTFVKLYCGAGDVESLLRGPVAELVALCVEQTGVDRWFFLRYADPDAHLRVRLRTADGRGFETLQAIASLLEPLLAGGTLRRYTFDTYRQELERYGGPEAIAHIETLFGCDSRRVVDALGTAPPSWAARVERSLAILAPFTCGWFGEFDLEAWLGVHAAAARSIRDVDWALVRAFRLNLLDAAALDGDERAAIEALALLERDGTLATDPGELFESLLHMHFNRIGVPMSDEPNLHAVLWHAWHGLRHEGRLPPGVRRDQRAVVSLNT
jgi:thiopeptide-type bacteriocin biosynthesis protein